jgi:acetylglutamate kinase
MEQLYVIKIGGNVIDDEASLSTFLSDFASVEGKKILIHGGGKIASRIGDKLGITSNYIDGRRITDAETIDLVTMVYGGLVNKKLVALLQSFQCNAIGITGADGNAIPASKRPVKKIDYGFVGDIDVKTLKSRTWELLLENDLVPVVSPLTHNGKGQMLNTNADTIASVLAILLSAKYKVRLVYCFEKKGVLEDVTDEHSVIPLITKAIYQQLVESKKLFEGILPKIDNAFSAIDAGVNEVLIGYSGDLKKNTSAQVEGTLIK